MLLQLVKPISKKITLGTMGTEVTVQALVRAIDAFHFRGAGGGTYGFKTIPNYPLDVVIQFVHPPEYTDVYPCNCVMDVLCYVNGYNLSDPMCMWRT